MMLGAEQRTLSLVRLLQNTLVERIATNPSYSLRSMARSLAVDPSLLSKILNGKRSISKKLFERICENLALSPTESELYAQELGRSRWLNPQDEDRRKYLELSSDHFHLISDWYHYAIFELMRLSSFQSSLKWIASSLGISPKQAQLALERMERIGLVSKQGDRWQRIQESISNIDESITNAALKKLQVQILEMGKRAMDEVPRDRRDQSSMTMAVDEALVGEAKELIAKFRRDISELMQKSNDLNQVYQLSISLYPLTRTTKKGDEHEE